MAYIGKTPTIGNFQVCDAISVVNGQAAYTMQVGSVNVSPESANHMLVSLNGILQKPGSSYTVSGSTITFASNLVTGDVIDFIQILGNVLDLGVPSDSTVSLAKLTATGTKSSSTFLRGDNTFAEPAAGGITEADQWRLTTDFTGSSEPISSNLERVDTYGFNYLGTGMTQSSGIFTFPSTGYYLITFNTNFVNTSSSIRQFSSKIQTTTDNSNYNSATRAFSNQYDFSSEEHSSVESKFIFDVTNTSTHKVRFAVSIDGGSSNIKTDGDTNENYTYMTFIRLGDT